MKSIFEWDVCECMEWDLWTSECKVSKVLVKKKTFYSRSTSDLLEHAMQFEVKNIDFTIFCFFYNCGNLYFVNEVHIIYKKNCQENEKCIFYHFYEGTTPNDKAIESVQNQPAQCFLYDMCNREVLQATDDCPLTK